MSLIRVTLAVLLVLQTDGFMARYMSDLVDELFAWQPGGIPLIWAALLVGIWLPVAAAFGVYEPEITDDPWSSVVQVSKATLVTLAIYVLIPYATPFLASRYILFSVLGIPLILTVSFRLIVSFLLSSGVGSLILEF